MGKKIKLQAIISRKKEHQHVTEAIAAYCKECGEYLLEDALIEEHVCEKCRFLVDVNDQFCSRCGNSLSATDKIEYYVNDKPIAKDKFLEAVKAKKLRGNLR